MYGFSFNNNKTCIRITQWKRTMKDIPAHQILPSPQLISHVPHDQLCLIFVKTTASHLSRPSHLSSPLFPAFQTQNKRSEVCSWLGQTKQKGSENFNHKEKPIHLRDKAKFRKEREGKNSWSKEDENREKQGRENWERVTDIDCGLPRNHLGR